MYLLIPFLDEQAWCSKACYTVPTHKKHHKSSATPCINKRKETPQIIIINLINQTINEYHLWMSRHGVVRLASSEVPEADGFED